VYDGGAVAALLVDGITVVVTETLPDVEYTGDVDGEGDTEWVGMYDGLVG